MYIQRLYLSLSFSLSLSLSLSMYPKPAMQALGTRNYESKITNLAQALMHNGSKARNPEQVIQNMNSKTMKP